MSLCSLYGQFITQASGTYTPHCLFIRAIPFADLEPDDGDDPYPVAIPTHVHEYIHHLHNISTSSGMHLFIAALWLLRSLPHGSDAYGHFPADVALNSDQQKWIAAAKQWTMALWGGSTLSRTQTLRKNPAEWNFDNVRQRTESLVTPDDHPGIDMVAMDTTIIDAEGELLRGTLNIGYDFISEGIAYEVDREVRRNNDPSIVDPDSGIPLYPYLAYRQVVDHFVGRPTAALERIELGSLP